MWVQPKDSKSFDQILEQVKKDKSISRKIKLVNKK